MFEERERTIFRFARPDGQDRYADPLVVRRGLLAATRGTLNKLLDRWELPARVPPDADGNPGPVPDDVALASAEAEAALVAAVRQVFNVPPVNVSTGEGVPDDYCLDLLQQFLDYLEKKDSTPPTWPTSVPPTGLPPGPSATTSTSG